jgi:hypothetical protein
MRREETDRPRRIERREHLRRAQNAEHAEHGERDEPDDHHRPEQRAHAPRATLLDREEAGDHRERERDHEGLESRRRDFQSFHRGQHGDRRRDEPVAVEERSAEEADEQQETGADRVPLAAQHQCHQCHDAAFALVVRAHDEGDVLDRHDDHQRPEHQRQDAEHVGRVDRHRMVRAAEDFLERVKRARADVAVDDAEGGEG